MDSFTVDIAKEYDLNGSTATLVCYVQTRRGDMGKINVNMDAMLIAPGGGYVMLAEREGEPIAIEFLSRKYNSFVLYYTVNNQGLYPLQLTEIACAVDYIKKNAEKLCVNKDRIFACGYSAGGHLVGCLANFHTQIPTDYLHDRVIDSKIAGVVLGYPVTTPQFNYGLYKRLLGEDACNHPNIERLTLAMSVNKDNPPCFVWATASDQIVPAESTLLYTEAYLKNGKKIESHIFTNGKHGGATCDARTCIDMDYWQCPEAVVWMDMADKFLKSL